MLWTLYVAAEQRAGGLARTLMERVIGLEPAQLWVFESNLRARAFYEKYGFRADGRRQTDPGTGISELRMVRKAAFGAVLDNASTVHANATSD